MDLPSTTVTSASPLIQDPNDARAGRFVEKRSGWIFYNKKGSNRRKMIIKERPAFKNK